MPSPHRRSSLARIDITKDSPPCAQRGEESLTSERLLVDHVDRLAVEPGFDVLDRAGIEMAIAVLDDVAEMRHQGDIVELADRMALGQRLLVVHVEAGMGDGAGLEGC